MSLFSHFLFNICAESCQLGCGYTKGICILILWVVVKIVISMEGWELECSAIFLMSHSLDAFFAEQDLDASLWERLTQLFLVLMFPHSAKSHQYKELLVSQDWKLLDNKMSDIQYKTKTSLAFYMNTPKNDVGWWWRISSFRTERHLHWAKSLF